jgi:hypothetical protein
MKDILLDVAALHGREAAKTAANMIIDEFAESDLKERRDRITKELFEKAGAKKEGA